MAVVASMVFRKACLIALWLEALFYGINSVLVWSCLFVLTYKKRREDIRKILFAIVITQYLVSTTDVALGLTGLIAVFGNPSGERTTNGRTPVELCQTFFISFNELLNNIIVVWRCYHIWGKNWKVIAFPILLILATITCAIGQMVYSSSLRNEPHYFDKKIMVWSEAFSVLTLSANIVGTSLSAFRIWSIVRKSSAEAAWSKYSRPLLLLIESGILYSAALVIGLVLSLSRVPASIIVSIQYGQLASIIPTMIMLLVGLKLTSCEVHRKDDIPMDTHNPDYAGVSSMSPSSVRPVVISVTTDTIRFDSESDHKSLPFGDGSSDE